MNRRRIVLTTVALLMVSCGGDDDDTSSAAEESGAAEAVETTASAVDTTTATTTELVDETLPDEAFVPVVFSEDCDEGTEGADEYDTWMRCVSTDAGPKWATVPEPLERDTAIAMIECGEALVGNLSAAALGTPANWSACDDAETLLKLEPAGFAETVGQQLEGCRAEANQVVFRLIDEGPLDSVAAAAAVGTMAACAEMLEAFARG